MRRILALFVTVLLVFVMSGSAMAQKPATLGPDANRMLRMSNGVALSLNWSGYALVGAKFSDVRGTFTVPPCNGEGVASYWVGVDGFSNTTLLQAGVSEENGPYESSCIIQAWWEDLPSAAVNIDWMNVKPGDQIEVSLYHEPVDMSAGVGPWDWSVSIVDLANGQVFNQDFNYSGQAKSVEWVTEAPTIFGGINDIMPYQFVNWTDLHAVGRAAQLADIWLVQDGREQSIPSAVGTTKQLMRQGFSMAYVG